MNTDRLAKIAEWLEAGGWDGLRGFSLNCTMGFHDFDVEQTFRRPLARLECCCDLAGYAIHKFGDPESYRHALRDNRDGSYDVPILTAETDAASLLGLAEGVAFRLFDPFGNGPEDDYNDPSWAAAVIRRLIATGKVDWPGCKPDPLVIMRNARKACGKQAPRTQRYQTARKSSARKVTFLLMAESMVGMLTRSAAMVAQSDALVASMRAAVSDER